MTAQQQIRHLFHPSFIFILLSLTWVSFSKVDEKRIFMALKKGKIFPVFICIFYFKETLWVKWS